MLLCCVLLEGISTAFSGMNTLVGLYCSFVSRYKLQGIYDNIGQWELFSHDQELSNNSLFYFFTQSYSINGVYGFTWTHFISPVYMELPVQAC
jgi:hypothetical protein